MSDKTYESDCGTLKGAQRHLHANEPVCGSCLVYLDAMIADVLSTTQHGTEAGYQRHMRDARRRKEWDRAWSPEQGVLTQRFYKKGEHNEYTGWIPQFLWPPIEECPHVPSCAEAHADYVRDKPKYEMRSERREREKQTTRKDSDKFGMCRPSEVPAVDRVMRAEWKRLVVECEAIKSILEPIADLLPAAKPTKLKATLNERAYHIPIPPVSDELTAVFEAFEQDHALPSTKLPIRAVLAHRVVEAGLVDFSGREWSRITEDDLEDIFG